MQVFGDHFLRPKRNLDIGLLEAQTADCFPLLNQALQEQFDRIEYTVIGDAAHDDGII